jgi:hypothetical protein
MLPEIPPKRWNPIDHKRAAERLLADAEDWPAEDTGRVPTLLAALVHAVLSTNGLGPI